MGIGGHGIFAICPGSVSGQHPPRGSSVLLQKGPSENINTKSVFMWPLSVLLCVLLLYDEKDRHTCCHHQINHHHHNYYSYCCCLWWWYIGVDNITIFFIKIIIVTKFYYNGKKNKTREKKKEKIWKMTVKLRSFHFIVTLFTTQMSVSSQRYFREYMYENVVEWE